MCALDEDDQRETAPTPHEAHSCDWFGRFTCRICGKHRDEPAAPASAAAEARVRELESELTDLRRSYSENTEKMILAEARLRELEAENTTLRVNNRVLEADNADLLDRRRAAESELAALRERVARAVLHLDPGDHLQPRVGRALEALRGS